MSLLELRHITKSYPGVVALNDVSLTVEAGTVHALIGENGAGKSTLLKVLAGATRPDHGETWLDGNPITCKSPRECLKRIQKVI